MVRRREFVRAGAAMAALAGLGANTIPQPVRQDDMVFVMTVYRNPNLMAIRLGREGDLTGTDAVVWTQVKGNSSCGARPACSASAENRFTAGSEDPASTETRAPRGHATPRRV